MTAECDCFVSSLEFSVAQWLDYLARVWKAVGSFPIWNSDSFSEFFSPHIFFLFIYFFVRILNYWPIAFFEAGLRIAVKIQIAGYRPYICAHSPHRKVKSTVYFVLNAANTFLFCSV